MRDLSQIDKRVMWIRNCPLSRNGMRGAIMDLPTGVRCSLVVGDDEEGWEHVSIVLSARRLPTWEEMCLIKDIFWDEEEMVVQIHPKKSEYVNLTEALHLWRPKDGNWARMNDFFNDFTIDHDIDNRKKKEGRNESE